MRPATLFSFGGFDQDRPHSVLLQVCLVTSAKVIIDRECVCMALAVGRVEQDFKCFKAETCTEQHLEMLLNV
jgi:hypothetical protein